MRIQFFANAFDNVVAREASISCTWEELCKEFGSHQVTARKNDLGFILADFKTEGDFKPALSRAFDSVTGALVSEEIKRTADGKVAVARAADNLVEYHGVVLDYDGGEPLRDVRLFLEDSHVRQLGYTSWSHRLPGKGDRFRIILPFDEPCPRDDWDLRKQALAEMFPGADPSSFSTARMFFVPCCAQENRHLAETWNAKGMPFDWRAWLPPREVPPPALPIDHANVVAGGHGRVVWRTFDLVGFMRDQGLYVRQVSATKHEVICPNRRHIDGGTVVYQDGHNFPVFYCSHSKCAGFSLWHHYRNLLGNAWAVPYCQREVSAQVGLCDHLKRHNPTVTRSTK